MIGCNFADEARTEMAKSEADSLGKVSAGKFVIKKVGKTT